MIGGKAFALSSLPVTRLFRAGEKLVFLALLLVLASVVFFHRGSLALLLYPTIRDAQLEGRFVHLERSHADGLVRSSVGEYFFDIDLYAIKQEVENLPWVKYVSVSRFWPHTLHVIVEEHHAEAWWGENALISSEAVVFNPPGVGVGQLPMLYASSGMKSRALEKYREARELLAGAGLAGIRELGEDPSGSWGLLLGNGVSVRVGDIHWQLRLKNFASAWQSVLSREADRIHYVDLRYPDGFAVAWKTGMEAQVHGHENQVKN